MAEEMTGNLYYATAMCRVHYRRVKEPIPNTVIGQAQYWKRYYNTPLGKGTEENYIQHGGVRDQQETVRRMTQDLETMCSLPACRILESCSVGTIYAVMWCVTWTCG